MSAQYVPGNRVPCSPEVRSFTDYKTGWLGAAASGILQGKILKSLVSSSLCKHPTGKREVNCFFFLVLNVVMKKRVSSKIRALCSFVK